MTGPGTTPARVLVNRHRSLLRRALLEARHARRTRVEEGYLPDHGEDRMVLWAAMQRLPARQRAVLVLRYHEDLSEATVALTVYTLLPPETLPCPTMNRHERTLTVVLPTPLRGRALVDGGGWDARVILGAVVREPSYLPAGYGRGVIGTSAERLGRRMATWERVLHRAHADQEQLWIIQGHPAAVRPRYHPRFGACCFAGKLRSPAPLAGRRPHLAQPGRGRRTAGFTPSL